MKRLIIMLLIASNAAVPTLAQSKSIARKKYDLTIMTNKEQQYPLRVFRLLRDIRDKFGMRQGQTYSVLKNPETGLIESAERITRFSCRVEELLHINQVFMDDEPFSYQILHLLPGNTQQFDIKVVSADGQRSTTLPIRTESSQEMWYLATKNLENPQLRDIYAIVWETDDFNTTAEGTIYGISSLRPDLYTKNLETSKNTFRIDGRVGYDLTDSLYVVYMADTSEELDKQADDAFIAYMPVKNKRFSFSVEIDKPKVGRIRTVMPDGSLCHLWTNLDFVPGETYQITTHNGYYDEDRDYERRVGRYSGKSLLNKRQIRGIDDISVVDDADVMIADTVAVEDVDTYLGRILPPEEAAKVEARVKAIQADMQMIDEAFEAIKNMPSPASSVRLEPHYKHILTLSKSIDTHFQGLTKVAKDNCLSPNEQVEMYKFIIDMYRYQNKKLNELRPIRLTKNAQKFQKYITSQTEKYLNEMTKL
ncbi:MAG: hypothetical protein II398_04080 [Prevotella sp.]|jgi:hypothetical protein|nr:hypothetical protein [Prevotella sp.]